MNNQELQQLIADYLHRTDLAALLPTWIDMARQRIGRDLRSQYNQVVLDPFSTTAQISPLPADYRGMKEISYTQGVARIQLRGGSVDALAAYAQTGIGTRWYRNGALPGARLSDDLFQQPVRPGYRYRHE